MRQLEKPAGVDFLVTAFQQHNLPFEEFKFVVMRMRLEIKRQVGSPALSCRFACMLWNMWSCCICEGEAAGGLTSSALPACMQCIYA